jgi:molybdenum-dependent DNA-binding transcriptional regulator ModE
MMMRAAILKINRWIIINLMKKIDHLALDGHALALFLAVLEEGSVTSAATRLGLTQSAVSHGLNKLRRIVGDPLFAKSGRGIVATAHAQALAAKARALIDEKPTRHPERPAPLVQYHLLQPRRPSLGRRPLDRPYSQLCAI